MFLSLSRYLWPGVTVLVVPSFLSSQPPAGPGRWPPFLVLVLMEVSPCLKGVFSSHSHLVHVQDGKLDQREVSVLSVSYLFISNLLAIDQIWSLLIVLMSIKGLVSVFKQGEVMRLKRVLNKCWNVDRTDFLSWLLVLVLIPAGSFCVEFACSPRICVGSLWVLRLPPTTQKHYIRLTADFKSGVSVHGWYLYVALWGTEDLSRMYPALCAMAAGIGSAPHNPELD